MGSGSRYGQVVGNRQFTLAKDGLPKEFGRYQKEHQGQPFTFYDLNPLFATAKGWQRTVTALADRITDRIKADRLPKPNLVVGIESRGLNLGGALALKLHAGYLPMRKKGKLPGATTTLSYELEYGSDELEIQVPMVRDRRVLLVDDVLATGGTLEAAARLVERAGGELILSATLVEIPNLAGALKLEKPLVTLWRTPWENR